MKRCYLSFLFFLFFILPINSFANTEENITFAAFYNFSGSQSVLDTFSANGAKLAQEFINKKGGLLGKKLNIVFLDGKSDPHLLMNQAEIIAKNPSIELTFGLSDSDMARAVIPPLAKASKLFLTSGATSPALPLLFPGKVFLACFSDEKQGKAAAHFSFHKLQAKKILILQETQSEYAKVLSQSYEKNWINLTHNNSSVKKITISKNVAQDLEIQDTLHSFQPDNIFIAAEPDVSMEAAKFLRNLNFRKPILGGDAFDTKEIRTFSGGNIYYTTHAFVNKLNPNSDVQNFIKYYIEKYKQDPDSSFAALGYDTVYLLARAVNLAKSTDPVKVANALQTIKNYPLLTGNVTYTLHSYIPEKSVTIIRINQGKKNKHLVIPAQAGIYYSH